MAVPTVGYIGLNHHHADSYLKSLSQLPVSVSCFCEPDTTFAPDPETLADSPFYRDPNVLLTEQSPDIIWITLPNEITPKVTERAIARGVDVYTEKPAATSADGLEALRDTVERSDATLCFSYPWRAHPAVRDLKRRAKMDFFGEVRAVEMRFLASALHARDSDHYLYKYGPSGGGIVQWLGVHWIDLIPLILEDPIVRVNASISAGTPSVSVEDGGVVQFEFASGALGSLHCGYYLREGRYDTFLSITGTTGRISWDPMGDSFGFDGETTVKIESAQETDTPAPRRYLTYNYDPTTGYGGGFGLSFMRQFLRARTDPETSTPAGLNDAISVLQVLDAIYESADQDEWVTIERSEA